MLKLAKLLPLVDAIGAFFIFLIFKYLRTGANSQLFSLELFMLVVTHISVLALFGEYDWKRLLRRNEYDYSQIRTLGVVVIGVFVCIGWVYLSGPNQFKDYYGRGVLPIGTLCFGFYSVLVREVLFSFFRGRDLRDSVLILGGAKDTRSFLIEEEKLSRFRKPHKKIFLGVRTHSCCDFPEVEKILISGNDFKQVLSRNWDKVILSSEADLENQDIQEIVTKRLQGTPVYSVSEYYEKVLRKVPVNYIADTWFFRPGGFSLLESRFSRRLKRLVDIGFSFIGLILMLPILLFVALMIKLDSRGPVFFRQQRVGKNGSNFTIYKFRTMSEHAESEGAKWASLNDSRVTRIGKFLRSTRVDEIPQFVNILKGEMSLIGPRPERPEFTVILSKSIPYYNLRHTVKPGLSGWAQVNYPYGASEEDSLEKLQYDLYYIKHHSLMLDVAIMLKTVLVVFKGSGR